MMYFAYKIKKNYLDLPHSSDIPIKQTGLEKQVYPLLNRKNYQTISFPFIEKFGNFDKRYSIIGLKKLRKSENYICFRICSMLKK